MMATSTSTSSTLEATPVEKDRIIFFGITATGPSPMSRRVRAWPTRS